MDEQNHEEPSSSSSMSPLEEIQGKGSDASEKRLNGDKAWTLEKESQKLIKEEQELREQQAKTAIENALIDRHIAKTGRKFPTREQNLKDALDWQTQEIQAEEDKVKKIITDTEAMQRALKKAEASGMIPAQPPKFNLIQRTVGLVKGVIGKK